MVRKTLSKLNRSKFLNRRYNEGLQTAFDAAQLLREKYKVHKVVLFGSLLDLKKFSSHSDIDLAVWGLADDDYYQALSYLSNFSSQFSFDLIEFESATASLQRLILQQGLILDQTLPLLKLRVYHPTERSMKQYSVLIGQIQQELVELENLVTNNQRLLDKIKATNDQDYVGTMALNLHSFYSGVERIFKQIAQTIDHSIPETADWHRQLLRQMTADIPDVRPSVIQQKTRMVLDEYCSFRHVVRNIYSINLKLERVQKLAEELPNCFQCLQLDLETFLDLISP